jgi:hypothetical protein
MIPMMNIIAWSHRAPWPEMRQVEQDLIISRAIVAIFSDEHLRRQLRFRGGTALNKLHFPQPFRYSEDIDLVRTESGPIGPVLDRLRDVLEPWLGRANFDQSPVAPKLRFKVPAEDAASAAQIRLKLEINTSETQAYDPPRKRTLSHRESLVHWFGRGHDVYNGRDAGDKTARAAAAGKGARPLRPCPFAGGFQRPEPGAPD